MSVTRLRGYAGWKTSNELQPRCGFCGRLMRATGNALEITGWICWNPHCFAARTARREGDGDMIYELDGIATAFEVEAPRANSAIRMLRCPCDTLLAVWNSDEENGPGEAGKAALRFHYTHCPQARRALEEN